MRVDPRAGWVGVCLLVVVLLGCNGSDTSASNVTAAITNRMNSIVMHFNNGDAKAILDDDVPASTRRTCTDQEARQVLDTTRQAVQATGTKLTVKSVSNVHANGSHATADVSFGVLPGVAANPVSIDFVKEHGDWLLDTSGVSGCNGIIPGGLH